MPAGPSRTLARELLPALAVGVVVALAGYAWSQASAHERAAQRARQDAPGAAPNLVLVFSDVSAGPDGRAPLLGVWNGNGTGLAQGQWVGWSLEAGNASWPPGGVAATLDGHVAVLSPGGPEGPTGASSWRLRSADGVVRATVHQAAASGNATARFGLAGHNATRLRLFAFSPQGQLLASNAPDRELVRFPVYRDYEGLPDPVWYLGDGKAPPGTTAVPEAARSTVVQLRAALTGLPVGGVAVAHVTHGPLAEAAGDVWLTAQVLELVDAP